MSLCELNGSFEPFYLVVLAYNISFNFRLPLAPSVSTFIFCLWLGLNKRSVSEKVMVWVYGDLFVTFIVSQKA